MKQNLATDGTQIKHGREGTLSRRKPSKQRSEVGASREKAGRKSQNEPDYPAFSHVFPAFPTFSHLIFYERAKAAESEAGE